MKRTLYFAFLALTLGSMAFAQDGRGRNKQDQRSDPPKQEQRRDTPPPPKREEPRRDTPQPPQRREEPRNTPPPPRRDDQNRDRTPPPPKRDEPARTPERNTPPPPRRDDNGRGQPRNDQPPRDRTTPPQPRRDDQGRGRTPDRNVPNEPRGGNRGDGRLGTEPPVRGNPGNPGTQRGLPGSHNLPIVRSNERTAFNPPPTVMNNRVTNRAWREDRAVRTAPYRSGYYQYNDTWRDSNFCYSHYAFDYGQQCAPSPWYWYPHMPAYVSVARCRPTVTVVFDFGYGPRYDYRPYYYTSFEPTRLDVAADRMEDSFRRRDFNRLSYLVDRDDWVQIQVENSDTYDLRGDDYADMMRDLIEQTHTISYRITDVRSWRDGASITARHTYVDSWGHREVVEHRYGFRMTREGYRIVSFRTDHF